MEQILDADIGELVEQLLGENGERFQPATRMAAGIKVVARTKACFTF